jgi:YD repeat-containing protein
MLSGPRSAIIVVLTALCPLTVYGKSHSLVCGATKPIETKIFATGAISGKVTRTDGTTAILSATVKVYQGTSLAGTATTNAAGDYTVGALNTGTYAIEASAVGYETTTQTGISVTDGATTTLNVSLPVPINYVYDDLGRLVAVIDKDGNAATYSYDAVGNLLSISRQAPTQVSIIQFSPGSGPVGASVTIYGAGFSATASQNTVTFNGVAASVTASSTNLIVTSVPAGAATGTISVTSPVGSVTSSVSFTVTTGSAGAPTITGFTPTIGVTGTAVTVNGTNFDAVALNNRPAFNIVNSTVTSATATSIATSTPLAGSGRISVTTPYGKATSSDDFFIPPPPYATADIVSTGRMTIGTPATVSVTTPGKAALRLFEGTMGQRIYLDITNVLVSGSSQLAVNLYDPVGQLLASKTVSFSTATFIDTQALSATGTYTVLAGAPNYPSNAGGSVTLTLYDVPPDFLSPIVAGGPPVSASITARGQNAKLAFNGTTGQRISLLVSGVTLTATSTISIINPNSTTLVTTTVNSAGQFIDTQTLPATGTYTILLDPPAAATGNATFTLYNVVDVVGSISPGGSAVNLSITTPGQNARYTFTGSTGQRISLNMTGVTISAKTVYIYKPDGATLTSTTGTFIDTQTLPADGSYTVFIDPSGSNIGTMTLTMYDTSDLTGTITPGGAAVNLSFSNPGQNARLTFTGNYQQRISLRLSSVTVPNSTGVTLLKPDGTTLTSFTANVSSGGWLDATVLPVAGSYTIVIDPFSSGLGSMTITLYDVVDLSGAITAGGSPVSFTVSTPGQNARYTFSGTTGQRVSLNVTGVTIQSSGVYILKPDGTTLASITNVSTAGAFLDTTTLPTTGTYTVLEDPQIYFAGNMTLSLYDVVDVNDTISAGGAAVTVSVVTPGQSARVTFSGTTGQRVSLRGSNVTILGTTAMTILKPDGTTLTTTNASSSAGGWIDPAQLPVTGTYTIVVDPSSFNTGSMTLTLYDVPADPTGSVTVGGSALSVTTTVPGQNATVTFSGTSGQQVTVHVTSNTMGIVTVKLLKPDGATLTTTSSGNTSFNLATQTLSVTGTYTISIDPIGANIGSMNVNVTSP